MKKIISNPLYYEKSDFSSLIKKSKKKKYVIAKTKRVTMNISEIVYDDAHKLDKYMNMGYQNVLKAAILLGLNDLFSQIETKSNLRATGK